MKPESGVEGNPPHSHMRRPGRRDALALGGAGALAGMGGVAAPAVQGASRYVWYMAVPWPDSGLASYAGPARDLAATITALSGGRLTVTPLPPGELSAPVQTLQAVADGVAPIGHGAPYYWAGEFPAMQFVAGIPFGLSPAECAGWLADTEALATVQSIYRRAGVHMFPAGNSGGKTGGWLHSAVQGMSDFRGLRLRVPGLGGTILREAGAEIVSLPAEDIAPALEDGRIDGTDWSGLADDLAFGLAQTGARLHAPPWQEPATVLDAFINPAAWESLPGDLQAVVETACAAVTRRSIASARTRNAQAYSRMRNEMGLAPPHEMPNEVLVPLGNLAGQVIADIASRDRDSRAVYRSLTRYRQDVLHWRAHGELGFLNARLLPFSYPG